MFYSSHAPQGEAGSPDPTIGVNEDENGNFLGNVNYAPYASCN